MCYAESTAQSYMKISDNFTFDAGSVCWMLSKSWYQILKEEEILSNYPFIEYGTISQRGKKQYL